jgi:hypothetical protein
MSTPPGAAPKAKGNVLTRKIGPLPTWAWTGIILTPILIYAVIERKKSSSSTTAASATTGMTSASQVPQFVNQTYTSVQAPSAPNSTGTTPVTTPVTTGPATTTTATTPTPTVSTPAPTPAPSAPVAAAAGGVVIPSEIGERANFAIGKLQSLGLGYQSTTGNRNPKDTYVVTAQSPAAGTQVPKGTVVKLTWKVGT